MQICRVQALVMMRATSHRLRRMAPLQPVTYSLEPLIQQTM
jgi:hypothetical protein